MNTEKEKLLLERKQNLSSLTQCPREWKTFTLKFHIQVNIPQSQVWFLKTITLTISHPRIRDTFPIDQFLPSHAHFQGHMG